MEVPEPYWYWVAVRLNPPIAALFRISTSSCVFAGRNQSGPIFLHSCAAVPELPAAILVVLEFPSERLLPYQELALDPVLF